MTTKLIGEEQPRQILLVKLRVVFVSYYKHFVIENRIIKQNVHRPFGAEHTIEKDHMIHVILLKHIIMKVVII
jgi:hypothetical protein